MPPIHARTWAPDSLDRIAAAYNEIADTETGDAVFDNDRVEFFAYDDLWRLRAVYARDPGQTTATCRERYAYNPAGLNGKPTSAPLDSPVFGQIDAAGDGTFERSFLIIQNHLGDVIKIIGEGGFDEEIRYTLFGEPYIVNWYADVNHDGGVDGQDIIAFYALWDNGDGLADLDGQNGVDGDDVILFFEWWDAGQGDGLTLADNRFGFRGYVWDDHLQLYHVRHRVFDPTPGPAGMRWLQRDPAFFVDGLNLYAYCAGDPVNGRDPMGLADWFDRVYYVIGGVGDVVTLGVSAALRGAVGYEQDTWATDAYDAVHHFLSGDGATGETGNGQPGVALQAQAGVRERMELAGTDDSTSGDAMRAYAEGQRDFLRAGPQMGSLAEMVILFEISPGLNIGGEFAGGKLLRNGDTYFLMARDGRTIELTAGEADSLLAKLKGLEGKCDDGVQFTGSTSRKSLRRPDAEKWKRSGGQVRFHSDGSVTYAKGQDSVTYSADGYPDFVEHLYNGPDGANDVRIALSGNRTADANAANKAAGFAKTPDGYVWHHHQDPGRMQLVDQRIHEEFSHTGGFSTSR